MQSKVHKLDRRALMTGTGAAVAALAASTLPAEPADRSLREIEALITRHAEAWRVDEAAWNLVPDNPARLPKVQVGKLLRGRDYDGNDVFDPIWAYSMEEVEQSVMGHLEPTLGMFGRTPEREAAIRESYANRLAALKAQLAESKAEAKRIQDQSGYTAALSRARATSDAVKEIEAEILSIVPGTLVAAARLAGWVQECVEDDEGRSYLAAENLADALRQIAKAGSSS